MLPFVAIYDVVQRMAVYDSGPGKIEVERLLLSAAPTPPPFPVWVSMVLVLVDLVVLWRRTT